MASVALRLTVDEQVIADARQLILESKDSKVVEVAKALVSLYDQFQKLAQTPVVVPR